MALSSKVGSITQPTSTGNQSITGLGFQPKTIIFFWGGEETADGSAANSRLGFGFAVSSTQRGFVWIGDQNGVATTNSSHNFNTTKCILFATENGTTPTTKADADFVSMDADGFTINWTTADATQRIVNYIALGGASLTNAFAGSFQQNNTTTNQSVTGVGFQPDTMIVISGNSASLGAGSDPSITIGVITSGAQKISHSKGRNALAASPHQDSVQKTDFLGWVGSNSDTPMQGEASFVSFDADGFTLISNPAGTRRHIYLCLKGASTKVGTFNQSTSTGNQAVTGVGFKPTAVMFQSVMKASSTSIDSSGARLMVGAASDSSNRAVNSHATNNALSLNASHDLDRTKCIKMIAEGGASPTTSAAADFVSNDSDGFTINNTTADATSREVVYLAFGPAAAAGAYTKGNFFALF